MSEPITPSLPASNWVHDVGFANEKLHAGMLSRLLLRSKGDAQRALVNALWHKATGQDLPVGPLAKIEATREAQLAGPRLRLDLLVSFMIDQRWFRLGFELKVDNPPDDDQLRKEVVGLAQSYPKDERALVLLCLGVGRVGYSQKRAGVHRWSPETLLALSQHLRAALPEDIVVAGWIESLAAEQNRYEHAIRTAKDAKEGYRSRNFESYWLGALQRSLDEPTMPSLSPWSAQLEANGPLITADGSCRYRQVESIEVGIFLEIHWDWLYVKAYARQNGNVVDPRPFTSAVISELETQLRIALPTVGLKPAQYKKGRHNSLLKLNLSLPSDPQEVRRLLTAVAAVWEPVTAHHGFLPEQAVP